MIRSITAVTFLLACGSGLYLYQAKHQAQMLDHKIEQTVRATDALREQTRMLHAEWTLLNDPERLRQLADHFLALKTVVPSQFTSLNDLGNRLPPVRAPESPIDPASAPEEEPLTPAPLATAQAGEAPPSIHAAEPPPHTAAAQSRSAAAPPPAPAPVVRTQLAEHSPVPPRPTLAQPPPPRPAASHVPASGPHGAPGTRAAIAAARQPLLVQPASIGSLLGMAHSSAPTSLPRPMPVNMQSNLYPSGGG